MSRVTPIVVFAIGLIGFGFFYHLISDMITVYFSGYIVNNEYYIASKLIWDTLPWIAIIIGVISLVLAGVFYGMTRQVIYE